MKKIYYLIIYFLLIVIIAGCNTRNNSSYSIVKESSCILPCWHNILMGKTEEGEFIEIVSKLQFLQKDSITILSRSSEIYDKEIKFIIQPKQSWVSNDYIQVESYFSKGKDVAINFFGSLGLTFGDFIRHNEQSIYLYTLILPSNYSVVSIIDKADNLAFQHRTYENEINLEHTTPVNALFLFYEEAYSDLMDEGIFSMGLLDSREISKIIYPWDGYGSIEKLYPPRIP